MTTLLTSAGTGWLRNSLHTSVYLGWCVFELGGGVGEDARTVQRRRRYWCCRRALLLVLAMACDSRRPWLAVFKPPQRTPTLPRT